MGQKQSSMVPVSCQSSDLGALARYIIFRKLTRRHRQHSSALPPAKRSNTLWASARSAKPHTTSSGSPSSSAPTLDTGLTLSHGDPTKNARHVFRCTSHTAKGCLCVPSRALKFPIPERREGSARSASAAMRTTQHRWVVGRLSSRED